MSTERFDRSALRIKPLSERANKVRIERDRIDPLASPTELSTKASAAVDDAVRAVRRAKAAGHPVVLAFGAHTIKNGLGPVLIRLIEERWVDHLATNGAGIIHDWEFAYQGESSEDVRANVVRGEFGIWAETGLYLNLALAVGAFEGLGYGESIGALVERDGLSIPARGELLKLVREAGVSGGALERTAAAADLLALIERLAIPSGRLAVAHPYKRYGVQAAAYRAGVPFTAHPMFGHDIIYTHPASAGAAIGRTAERDFLSYAATIARIDGGVYLSVGSAVMSPMIFEKSLSMAQNIAIQQGRHIEDHVIFVVDLADASWDWQTMGEPPPDNPAYYLRYCKTFSRMGGEMTYVSADNRSFLVELYRRLTKG